MNFDKKDATGQVIHPGDVCVRVIRDGRKFNKSSLEFCVYSKPSWGGKGSKGEYGQFITPHGKSSLKFTSVIFAFDPMGERRNKSEQVAKLAREFYEG